MLIFHEIMLILFVLCIVYIYYYYILYNVPTLHDNVIGVILHVVLYICWLKLTINLWVKVKL